MKFQVKVKAQSSKEDSSHRQLITKELQRQNKLFNLPATIAFNQAINSRTQAKSIFIRQ